jgi:hypothetical protein
MDDSTFGSPNESYKVYGESQPFINNVFISYSTPDRDRIDGIGKLLEAFGHQVFHDHRSIKLGRKWKPSLGAGLEKADGLMIYWTHRSAQSDWVRKEYEFFHRHKPDAPLVPIKGDDTPLTPILEEHQSLDLAQKVEKALEVSGALKREGKSPNEIVDGVVEALAEEGYVIRDKGKLRAGLLILGGFGWWAAFKDNPMRWPKEAGRATVESLAEMGPGAAALITAGVTAAVLTGVATAPQVRDGLRSFLCAGARVATIDFAECNTVPPEAGGAPARSGDARSIFPEQLAYDLLSDMRLTRDRVTFLASLLETWEPGADTVWHVLTAPDRTVEDTDPVLAAWPDDDLRRAILLAVFSESPDRTQEILDALAAQAGIPGGERATGPETREEVLRELLADLGTLENQEAILGLLREKIAWSDPIEPNGGGTPPPTEVGGGPTLVGPEGTRGATRPMDADENGRPGEGPDNGGEPAPTGTGIDELIRVLQRELWRGRDPIVVRVDAERIRYLYVPYMIGVIPGSRGLDPGGIDDLERGLRGDPDTLSVRLTPDLARVLLLPYQMGVASAARIPDSRGPTLTERQRQVLAGGTSVDLELTDLRRDQLFRPFITGAVPVDDAELEQLLRQERDLRERGGVLPTDLTVTPDLARLLLQAHFLGRPGQVFDYANDQIDGAGSASSRSVALEQLGESLLVIQAALDARIATLAELQDSILRAPASITGTGELDQVRDTLLHGQTALGDRIAALAGDDGGPSPWLVLAAAMAMSEGGDLPEDTPDGVERAARRFNERVAGIERELGEGHLEILDSIRALKVAGQGSRTGGIVAPGPFTFEDPSKPGVFKAPTLRYRPDLLYPSEGRDLEGVVDVEALIGTNGEVTVLGATAPDGLGVLATAARESVSEWRFNPGTLNGTPVDVRLRVAVTFAIADRGES